jgi:hypothetical protein
MRDNFPFGKRTLTSARVNAFFGVVAVDRIPVFIAAESSRGQVMVAFVSTISPFPVYFCTVSTSVKERYFSIRLQDTKPACVSVRRRGNGRRVFTLYGLYEGFWQSTQGISQL